MSSRADRFRVLSTACALGLLATMLLAPPPAMAAIWTITTVDSVGDVGWHTSIAVNASGLPRISYWHAGNSDLKYASFNGATWTTATVDSFGDVGKETSLRLDSSGNPHISYWARGFGTLKYATHNGTSWSLTTVDTGDVGEGTSIALDSSENPHIAYWDRANGDLKYARFNGTTWTIATVDTTGNVGRFPSLELDASDNPHITYWDVTNLDLKYATHNGTTWTLSTVDSAGDVGSHTSLELDSSDLPRVGYRDGTNGDLEYAAFNGTSWAFTTVDTVGNTGFYTSMDLDNAGNPRISYLDATAGDLKVAIHDGTSWTVATVDSVGNTGFFTSLAIDGSGGTHVGYTDFTNRDLKYATLPPSNTPPTVAADQAAVTVDEGDTATNTGSVNDDDGDTVTLSASVGTIVNNSDGTWSWSWTTAGGPDDSQTVTIDADDGNGGMAQTTFDLVVDNVAPVASASSSSVDVQYSDAIAAVTISATDVAADTMNASTSWNFDGGGFSAGLPDAGTVAGGLSFTGASNQTSPASWTLSGVADLAPGTYVVRVAVSDDDGGSTEVDITIEVAPEDADVAFDGGNPVAEQVTIDGGDSGMFTLDVALSEPVDSSPGDIEQAIVAMDLVPVGPGSSVAGTCTPNGGGDWSCSFDAVPVNAYTVEVTVGGYYTGSGEDVLVVFDPSLGFTTGGGTYEHPSGDRVNFGYTMKYNKKRTNVKGNLVVIRHTDDGVYRLKSNKVEALAIGTGAGFSWASFSGKATYKEPDWPDAVGNYEFVAYVEDHATPGAGEDRFWVTAQRDGDLAAGLSLDAPASTNAETLTGGNLVVPH